MGFRWINDEKYNYERLERNGAEFERFFGPNVDELLNYVDRIWEVFKSNFENFNL